MMRITRRSPLPFAPAAGRRGSVILVVVAVLAVLVLLMLTFSYSTRVELLAARNWGNTVQARMAAVTGVPQFQDDTLRPISAAWVEPAETGRRRSDLAPVPLQLRVASLHRYSALEDSPAATEAALGAGSATADNRLAETFLVDTSALLNINAVVPVGEDAALRVGNRNGAGRGRSAAPPLLSEDVLARLIEDALSAYNIKASVSPRYLAHAIALRRHGPDGRPGVAGRDDNLNSQRAVESRLAAAGANPRRRAGAPAPLEQDGLDNNHDGRVDEVGEGIDEPAEAVSDPRGVAPGDDRPYQSLFDLMTVPGMTPEIFAALAPHLTTLSVSHAAFEAPDLAGEVPYGWPQIDPNTAQPEEIFERLRLRFPQASTPLLAQFAVNVVDRRDADDVPTEFKLDNVSYFGIERNPVINEVCPDTSSFDEDGDDGQFIELFNPYSEPLALEGWRLRGAGPEITLSGALPPGGFLVLTDDFNNATDPTPEDEPGQGSLYNIFGVVPVGESKQIKEFPQLDLDNESGEVKLINPDGQVVDAFAWRNGRWDGAPSSFQRVDPRLRAATRELATPLAPNRNQSGATGRSQALEVQETWRNQPYRSALDVMLVSSAWADITQPGQEPEIKAWQLPALREASDSQLDLRLVDVFRVGARPRGEVEALQHSAAAHRVPADTAASAHPAALGDLLGASQLADCPVEFGLINVNRASLAVLNALPGMDEQLLLGIRRAREAAWLDPADAARLAADRLAPIAHDAPEWWTPVSIHHPNRWSTLSEFLLDELVWGNRPLYDRLDAAYPFAGLITFHSRAIRVGSASRVARAGDQPGDAHRWGQAFAERIITADRGGLETVNFRFLRPIVPGQVDPDLRYAAPASRAAGLDLRSLINTSDPATLASLARRGLLRPTAKQAVAAPETTGEPQRTSVAKATAAP